MNPKKTEPHTHIIHHDKTDPPAERIENIYTITGKQDYIDSDKYPCLNMDSETAQESANAYAIEITIGKHTKYYVKRGKYGRIFNPIGMFMEGMATKRLGHAGRLEWKFQEISERAFNFYKDFLKTRNVAYLNNAERELL